MCSGEMVTLGGGTGMEQDALEHWGKPCPIHDEPVRQVVCWTCEDQWLESDLERCVDPDHSRCYLDEVHPTYIDDRDIEAMP